MQNIDCQIKLGHLAEARDLAFDILRQDNLCAAAHLVVANTFLAECDSERNRTFARRHISQAIIVAEALGEEQVVKEARSQCDELDRIDESKGQSAERNKKEKEIGIDDGRNFKPDTDIALKFIFHPHLGFILNQVSDQQTKYSSNLPGFRYLRGEEVEYPHCPDDDAFIVGLFGGSVSGQLYLTHQKVLREAIAKHPFVGKRRVVVLQFAQGSYKQPQHFFTLAYYSLGGQKFDLVVNLDGFNEAVGNATNLLYGVNQMYPSAVLLSGMAVFQNAQSMDINSAKHLIRTARRRRLRSALSIVTNHKIGSFLFGWLRNLLSEDQASSLRSLEDDNGTMFIDRVPRRFDETVDDFDAEAEKLAEDVADLWFRSSTMMQTLCSHMNAGYLHVLQPNQYYWSKSLSPEEKEHFYKPERFEAKWARRVYPHFLELAKNFTDHGVNFENATDVMDDVTDTVLVDSACHFNEFGDSYIMARIVEAVNKCLDGMGEPVKG